MSRILPFGSIEHQNDVCRGKDCMKRFCESLKQHSMKIIIFKKKKKSYYKKSSRNQMEIQKYVVFVKRKLKINI